MVEAGPVWNGDRILGGIHLGGDLNGSTGAYSTKHNDGCVVQAKGWKGNWRVTLPGGIRPKVWGQVRYRSPKNQVTPHRITRQEGWNFFFFTSLYIKVKGREVL